MQTYPFLQKCFGSTFEFHLLVVYFICFNTKMGATQMIFSLAKTSFNSSVNNQVLPSNSMINSPSTHSSQHQHNPHPSNSNLSNTFDNEMSNSSLVNMFNGLSPSMDTSLANSSKTSKFGKFESEII